MSNHPKWERLLNGSDSAFRKLDLWQRWDEREQVLGVALLATDAA